MWGWYDKQGNTAEKNKLIGVASGVTTVIAIPVFAPMIAPASTLVLFNKNIANFTHKRWENQCSKSFGFCDRTFS